MAKAIIVVTGGGGDEGAQVRTATDLPIRVETGEGQVYISYDINSGLFIKAIGDKAKVTIKLNDKALA